LAIVGRVVFAPLANFKPVTAIVIICGLVYGRRAGLACGAVSTLVSNCFFGQGPWTLLQLVLWAAIGWLAGLLAPRRRLAVIIFGVVASLAFGFISDSFFVFAFLRPQSLALVWAGYAAGVIPNLIHAASTLVFLALLWLPWSTKLRRIRRKYAML
jgi:energy-coupling factor transport system substrate-specific component